MAYRDRQRVVGNALPRALTGVAERGRTGQAHVEFIGRFLRAGKDGSLQAAKPYNELPYPYPDRLEALLSIPLIRQILPIELYGDAGPVATRQRPLLFGARFYLGVARLKQALLSKAAALIGLGWALLITALVCVVGSTKQRCASTTGPNSAVI